MKIAEAGHVARACLAAPAFAVIGTVDDVPAATLLLPYFEVDLDDPNGVTTLLSINNASATAVLAHVVLWTDLSVHVLDFNVYLTGYDVQSINLRDILVNGNLPLTASAGQDPTDTISPQGPASQDINFASCTGILPYATRRSRPTYIDHVQSTLTGQALAVLRLRRRLRRLSTMATTSPAATSRSTPSTPAPRTFPQRCRLLRDRRPVTRPTRTSSGATTSTSTRDRTSPRARRWCTSRRTRRSTAANYTFYDRYSALNGLRRGQP